MSTFLKILTIGFKNNVVLNIFFRYSIKILFYFYEAKTRTSPEEKKFFFLIGTNNFSGERKLIFRDIFFLILIE